MRRLWQVLLIAFTLTGCGGGESYVPVTGTVKYSDGSVPTGDVATITFQPADAGPDTKGAFGTIEPDGSFSLTTLQPGDGARPGEYRVTVHVMQGYPQGRLVVAREFANPQTTPLTETVEARGENHFDFVVERP